MPFYSYKCVKCGEITEEMRSFSRAEECPECSQCKGDTERVFDPGDSVGVNYVGWGWGDKCRKFGQQRTKRSEEMKKIQKDHYGNDTFVKKAE